MKSCLSLLGVVFFVASVSFAEENAAASMSSRPSLLQVGGNYTYVSFKPTNTASFSGSLGGAQVLYEYRPLNCFYAGLKGMWRQGNTTNETAERSLLDIDAHERLGYTFAIDDQRYLVTLFGGFGYRYLGQTFTDGGMTLELNYNEFYVPVGVLFDYKVTSSLVLGLYGTWMPQVNPTVTLVPITGIQWDIKRRLANFLIEMPLTVLMGDENQFSLIFKPFYEYWQDGESTAVTISGVPLGLPGNTYNFAGIEVNAGYQF